jgi:hypothetical protein
MPYSESPRKICQSGPILIKIRCNLTCFRPVQSLDVLGWCKISSINQITITITINNTIGLCTCTCTSTITITITINITNAGTGTNASTSTSISTCTSASTSTSTSTITNTSTNTISWPSQHRTCVGWIVFRRRARELRG